MSEEKKMSKLEQTAEVQTALWQAVNTEADSEIPREVKQAIAASLAVTNRHIATRAAIKAAQGGGSKQSAEKIAEAEKRRIVIAWGKANTKRSGTGKTFGDKVFTGDIPVQVYLTAYEEFERTGTLPKGVTEAPKMIAATATEKTEQVAAEQQSGSDDNSSEGEDKEEPSDVGKKSEQSDDVGKKSEYSEKNPTPRIEPQMQKLGEIAYFLGLAADNTTEALNKVKGFIEDIKKVKTAESLRANTKKSTLPILNSVGMYLGVISTDNASANLLPFEVKSKVELCNLIHTTVHAYNQQQLAAAQQAGKISQE